ncbi:MAG: IPT/TIG domain-containing protein [Gemmataceae bacterium]
MPIIRDRLLRRRRALGLELLEDRCVPTLLGNQLFPNDNPWNQRITNAPLASNSQAIMDRIVNTYGNNRLHPDFGQNYHDGSDLYGIPYNVVHGNTVGKVNVVIDAYPDESDLVAAPVPASVVLEGDFQNGPRVGVDNRGDSHLLLYDVDNNVAYEFYRMSRPSENSDGKWHADQESVWDMKTNTFRTVGWTSADAAGLSILAGLVRPDEALPASQGGQGVINHAIRFTLQNAVILDQFLYPASHTANPGNTNAAVMPPMGARFRLKAGVDLSQLNPQSRVIAQAMKDYGMIVADNGSNFFFSGASSSVNASNQQVLTFDDDDIQDTLHGLKSLHYGDFEVVDLTPAVTGLSATSGAAGSTVTVTGRNFSGAAGRLKVLFGGTAATSVTVVDDGHVTAVVPAGSGTVDVRVQSGVSTASNPDNVRNNIFGYGISAVSTSARFTYGAPPTTQAPAITSAAGVTFTEGSAGTFTVTATGVPTPSLSAAGALPGGVTFVDNGNGTARLAGTPAPNSRGVYGLTITASNGVGQPATQAFTLTINAPPPTTQAPAITSPAGATFTTGTAGTFTVTATGAPTPSLALAGQLPPGVAFADNGNGTARLSGTPAPGSQGVYGLTVTASNGVGQPATQAFTLTVNAPPPPPSQATITAVGTNSGAPGAVAVYSPAGARTEWRPYGDTVTGGVRVAVGDVNRDGVNDVIVAPGPGTAPTVKVYSGVGYSLLASFNVFTPSYRGGVFVAAGDVLGLGAAQVVVGVGAGLTPVVKVYDLRSGIVFKRSIQAFASNLTYGVTVAADTGLLVAGLATQANNVRVYDGANLSRVRAIQPFGSNYRNGVTVASAGGHLAVGRMAGGSDVRVYRVTDLVVEAVLQTRSTAPATGQAGGTRVAWTRSDSGGWELMTGTGPGWPGLVQFWVVGTWQRRAERSEYGGWIGGVWVA